MAKRKTIEVEKVKEIVNNLLANSTEEVTSMERLMAARVLERVLFETGNYKGFGYLPGVIEYTEDTHSIIGDVSRRHYY